MERKTSMNELFQSVQTRLVAELGSARTNAHPTASGDAAEYAWCNLLAGHLPRRYRAETAFVMDCSGAHSEQIDIVVYDAQYTPRLSDHNGVLWVPAESVYAVLEVKPTIRGHVKYAGKKAASVRGLTRTSACIPHAGGILGPKEPGPILAGIVADCAGWAGAAEPYLTRALKGLPDQHSLDLGCSADGLAFVVPGDGPADPVYTSGPASLTFFLVKLVERLRDLATVPALDFGAYLSTFQQNLSE